MIEPGIVEIRTTFASRAAATDCAERLVRAGLAACVQVDGPITSTYSWRGAVETAEEWRCSCKTTAEGRAACLEAIRRLHDYDTPELIVSDLLASAPYAAWVRAAVGAGERPPRDDA
jgi:periplasmic divalent cation tolerance protein